jgi:predicted PurR-regulated permease PerM
VQDIDPQSQQYDPQPLQAVPQLTITPAQCQQLFSLLQQQSIVQQPFANMAGSITTTSFAPASTSSFVTGSISQFFFLFFFFFFYLNPKHSVFSSISIPKFSSSRSKSTP